MFSRLVLLTAGNDPKLAELFARRAQARQLHRIGRSRRLGGLGDRRRKPAAARHVLIKMLVFMQLFRFRPNYCEAVWPN